MIPDHSGILVIFQNSRESRMLAPNRNYSAILATLQIGRVVTVDLLHSLVTTRVIPSQRIHPRIADYFCIEI